MIVDDATRPLNYCTHALEDLRRVQEAWTLTAPKSAWVLARILVYLEHSIKFMLPNCCELIAPDELRQAHVDIARLPYPCVAFEAPWHTDEPMPPMIGGFEQQRVTKRIALCWEARPELEPRPGLNQYLDFYPQGGVFVFPIYWGPNTPSWTIGPGAVFCPYDDELKTPSREGGTPATRIATAAAAEAGLVDANGKELISEPVVLFPELYDRMVQHVGSREEANAAILLDTRDESSIQLQVCAVLACANVETADVEPSEKLNKKRVARGRQRFFTYKVLELTNERAARATAQGGRHASPREHLRRGHIRRLQGDRVVWVRPTMVNAGSLRGTVQKDYRVTASNTED